MAFDPTESTQSWYRNSFLSTYVREFGRRMMKRGRIQSLTLRESGKETDEKGKNTVANVT